MISKVGARIPVLLGDAPSGSADDFVGRPPVIYVRVGRDGDGSYRDECFSALIDTGTDITAIDLAAAVRIKAVLFGNGVARGFGGVRAGIQRTHIHVFLPSVGAVYGAQAAAVLDFRQQGQNFDLILGRDFLRHCRLTVDGVNGSYELEWIG